MGTSFSLCCASEHHLSGRNSDVCPVPGEHVYVPWLWGSVGLLLVGLTEFLNGQYPQSTARDSRPRSSVWERGLMAHHRSCSRQGRLLRSTALGADHPHWRPWKEEPSSLSPPPHSSALLSPGGELLYASGVPVLGACHSGMFCSPWLCWGEGTSVIRVLGRLSRPGHYRK